MTAEWWVRTGWSSGYALDTDAVLKAILTQILNEASAQYWLRRAEQMRDCPDVQLACRRHAALIRMGAFDIDAEVTNALREAS